MSKKILTTLLTAFVTAFFLGCETIEQAPKPNASGVADTSEGDNDTMRAGDRVRVILYDIPTPPPAVEQVIPENGILSLHMNVEYKFAGKKRADAEKEIALIYTDDRRIYKKITVVVEKQATFISIGGEVRNPNSLVHRGDLTVLSAIDAAGGFTEFAKRSGVIVTRGSNKRQMTVDAKKAIVDPKLNLPLYPGDSVYVPRSRW
jgi:polysaccharide export outer membrane protein